MWVCNCKASSLQLLAFQWAPHSLYGVSACHRRVEIKARWQLSRGRSARYCSSCHSGDDLQSHLCVSVTDSYYLTRKCGCLYCLFLHAFVLGQSDYWWLHLIWKQGNTMAEMTNCFICQKSHDTYITLTLSWCLCNWQTTTKLHTQLFLPRRKHTGLRDENKRKNKNVFLRIEEWPIHA